MNYDIKIIGAGMAALACALCGPAPKWDPALIRRRRMKLFKKANFAGCRFGAYPQSYGMKTLCR